ncbi:MAG: WbuC family cupin fold metalloprotein [Bacteroidaceae bacterium]|nr:WbuC family cupin fold metalloprotein [Bacteroidaceae bacterium]
MNTWLLYFIIAALLVGAELLYFRIADKCHIVDKPKEKSSHFSIARRGGGVIFLLSIVLWGVMMLLLGNEIVDYLPFLCGLLIVAVVSFWEEFHSVPDSVRVAIQFVAMGLMFWTMGVMYWDLWWKVLIALTLFVGAMNVINAMDGINGITAGYSIAVLLPLFLLNNLLEEHFMLDSLLGVSMLGVLVFGFYNFRPNGMAKTFAGSVGSVGIAFILLFAMGKLIIKTSDITWLAFLVVYGVDGCLTIFHQIIRRESIGRTHRKHAYQLMANELGMNHVVVSCIYMGLQLVISLIMIYLIPDTAEAHWIYLIVVGLVLSVAYILFMKKYYHLYEAYMQRLRVESCEKITPAFLDSLTEQAKVSPDRYANYDLCDSDKGLSRRMLYAIEPACVASLHRNQKSVETLVCMRGRVVDEFYDALEQRCIATHELSPSGPSVALNIPVGQWHKVRALESGTVFLVVQDGKPEMKKPSLVYVGSHYELSRNG